MTIDPDALVSLDEARAQLKKSEGDNADDPYIEDLINRASKYCEGWVGRKFTQQTINNAYLDGYGTESINIEPWPVIGITELRSDGARNFGDSTLLYPWNPSDSSGHYILEPETGIVTRVDGWRFPYGYATIRASFTAGYLNVPAAIKQGVVSLIDKWFDERQQSASGQVQSERIGSYSVTYAVSATGTDDPVMSRVFDLWRPFRVEAIAERPSMFFTV